MANRNFANSRMYTGHVMPVLIDCNFVVDSTNGNGLGIRSLKGPYVKNVFMHTSATPAAGSPNPAAGLIVVQLADNYFRSISGFGGFVSPVTSPTTPVTSGLVVGSAAIITSVGTTTTAQWQSIGLQAGLTPAVGQAFTVTATGTSGSGTIGLAGAAGIDHIETIGDPNQSIAPQPSSNQGALFLMQCMLNGTKTAPADGTVITLAFELSNSSITIQGE